MKINYVTTKARNTLDRNALELNEYRSDPRSYEHNWTSGWNKAWKKNSGPYGIWIHDLCDTGAALYQQS